MKEEEEEEESSKKIVEEREEGWRTTKVMKCCEKKERRLMVGWFRGPWCAPSSARLTRFNETHDERTHTQREGLPYRHCTWQMYKTPAGVYNSVAHHLEHPHNEGGFISREQKFVSEILKKYCPNPMAGICYSSSHRRCGRHATRCRQTASWNHHVRERRTQFGRQLQIQVSYYINDNISKLLLDLYSIHFRIELKIN